MGSRYVSFTTYFLPVLELMDEIGVEAVENALNKLSEIVVNDYSAEKIRLIHKNEGALKPTQEKPYGTDRLSKKSKQSLSPYDMLRNLQTRKGG